MKCRGRQANPIGQESDQTPAGVIPAGRPLGSSLRGRGPAIG